MRRLRHLKPREIQGCQLALDASIPTSLYDATSGGSLVGADGAVARWEDQSGNGRHATQSNASSRPSRKVAVQGGNDAVRFNGLNRMLHGATSENDPNTIFAAVAWRNTGQSGYRGIISYGSFNGSMLLMQTLSNKVGSYGNMAPSGERSSTYAATSAPFVVTQVETTSPALSWRVNLSSAGTSPGDSVSQSPVHIGGIDNQLTNFDCYQAAIWSLALPDYVQNRIHASAMRKWRIAS